MKDERGKRGDGVKKRGKKQREWVCMNANDKKINHPCIAENPAQCRVQIKAMRHAEDQEKKREKEQWLSLVTNNQGQHNDCLPARTLILLIGY